MLKEVTRVLFLHNHYQQPGGEDQVFTAESDLLEVHGHRVLRYTMHNNQVVKKSSLGLSKATVWNSKVYRDLRALIRSERPQVAHFHNTFPLISPAAYYAARTEGVPVVQTLHNYRLLCPNALFFREGKVCEDCLDKTFSWPGIVHACYRESRPASGVVAAMQYVHWTMGTWIKTVDAYIALTEFARKKFIEGGLPADKIMVKPNFVNPDPGAGDGEDGYFLFVGRLSQEKGMDTLLAAWEHLGEQASLKIVGDGPLAPEVAKAAKRVHGLEWVGRQPRDQVLTMMKNARALIFPSVWYEGFPMVIVEAYAVGLPVISSNLGSMSSLVDHGRTGLRFRPGDPQDLATQAKWALAHSTELDRMRREARAEFEDNYTAERNYRLLMKTYQTVVERVGARA